MSFQDAFKEFAKELRRDKDLYRTYQANIAMAYQDCAHWEGSRDSIAKRHAIGNRAADHFLKLLLTPIRPQRKTKKASLRRVMVDTPKWAPGSGNTRFVNRYGK